MIRQGRESFVGELLEMATVNVCSKKIRAKIN